MPEYRIINAGFKGFAVNPRLGPGARIKFRPTVSFNSPVVEPVRKLVEVCYVPSRRGYTLRYDNGCLDFMTELEFNRTDLESLPWDSLLYHGTALGEGQMYYRNGAVRLQEARVYAINHRQQRQRLGVWDSADITPKKVSKEPFMAYWQKIFLMSCGRILDLLGCC